MAKVTYLLGAGASAQTIPVVANMPDRMSEIVEFLGGHVHKLQHGHYEGMKESIQNNKELLISIHSDLLWLNKEAELHFSIDTLAKKFYLSGDSKMLQRLKSTLIWYFIIEQLMFFPTNNYPGYEWKKMPIDKRYDSFIAAISQKGEAGLVINPEVNLLSWNYDMQLELSLKRFTGLSINKIKHQYSIFPNPTSYNRKAATVHITRAPLEFQAVKLNGHAVWDISSEDDLRYTVFDSETPRDDNDSILGDALSYLARMKHANGTSDSIRYFNFAWENGDDFESERYLGYEHNIQLAENIAIGTKYLVVIGYSFPVFNRYIDKLLLNSMASLEKVYIQDPDPERIESTMKNAFERFQLRGNLIRFQLETSINQFVIPYEL